MNKIVLVVFAVAAVALAEPPSQYGAPQGFGGGFSSFSSGGYDDGGNDGAQLVDSQLLARVAQILEQSDSSSRSFSSSYGAPSSQYGAPSSQYGAPTRFGGSSGITLGRPERAQRVAEFDLSSGGFRSGGYNNGGYNNGGYN